MRTMARTVPATKFGLSGASAKTHNAPGTSTGRIGHKTETGYWWFREDEIESLQPDREAG